MVSPISPEMIPEHDAFRSATPPLPGYSHMHRQGLQGQFSPKMAPENNRKSIYPLQRRKERLLCRE